MIKFHCACGELLGATDDDAGKWGSCPVCREPLHVPLRTDLSVPARLAEGRALGGPAARLGALCPHCHAALPYDAVMCTACGEDLLERRRRIEKARRGGPHARLDPAKVAVTLLVLVGLGILLGLLAYALTR